MSKKGKKETVEIPVEKVTKNTKFEVKDPQVLRPEELPLVITPENKKWDNEAQVEYSGYLNAYAYKNPEKWALKKTTLLKRLEEIGKDPKAIVKYRGNRGSLSFKNKLMQE